ncbi:MAG: ferritin-like domain-containing protein [Sphingomonadales bacterium]|nr:MAG: ferritin-like domain-containing protein [Sphingomonadales bacterium]
MLAAFRRRYLDLLGSIYIYNEHRGYTSIDRVLQAVKAREPENTQLIADIEKHRGDEHKHYVMFKRWFELQGRMPLQIDRTCGHIDRFVEIVFRRTIDQLDTDRIIAEDDEFEKLCRVISLTEQRGHKQVEVLLKHPLVKPDKTLIKIFQIIEKDEPSHWAPYDGWLKANGKRDPKWWERAIDSFIHSELLFLKLPVLFLNPWVKRRTDWQDADDPAPMRARVA